MKDLFFVIVAASLLFVSCDNNKEARDLYNKAKELYNQGDYLRVKEVTDSIKIVDSNAFDEIRAGIQLSRKAELAIHEQNMLQIDSTLKMLQTETNNILNDFEYIKDEEYETSASLFYKHDPNRHIQTKSGLRAYVTEEGLLEILSIHYGNKEAKHESFKLSLDDGSFIMSDIIPYDGANNYRYDINGAKFETIRHKEPKTSDIAQFIINSKGAPIKVSYDGKNPYSFNLEKSTRKAIIESYKLSEIIKQTKEYQRDASITSQTISILKRHIEDHEGDSI